MKALIFTEQALSAVSNALQSGSEVKIDGLRGDDFLSISADEYLFFVSHGHKDKDFSSQPLAIINGEIFDALKSDIDNFIEALQKIQRVLIHSQRKQTSGLPPWTIFHFNNRISIALSCENSNGRVFIEHNLNGKIDLFAYKYFDNSKHGLDIQEHAASQDEYKKILSLKPRVQEEILKQIDEKKLQNIDNNYSFDLVFDSEEQRSYTFEMWLSKLSRPQRHFVDREAKGPIRLKGPAGTGKTLALEMKAAKLLKENTTATIIFLTHSWTVAAQVQEFLDRILNESELKRIDVFPLLTFAESTAKKNSQIVTLGDDSYSGKTKQIEILKGIIGTFLKSDWIGYRSNCSKQFIDRIESSTGEDSSFVWDVLIEFACVIGANGIMPIRGGNEKYKTIERRPWMMPLSSSSDQDVIFEVYQLLMKSLIRKKQITADQLINDYLNELSTYNWFYERPEKGYDFVFVDETQLFNAQERLVFQKLTKDTENYPNVFMALDPKQSIIETFYEFGISSISQNSDDPALSLVGERDINLDEAFRYTRHILAFLKHVDSAFPALGLSGGWNNNIQSITSRKDAGEKVAIKRFANSELEFDWVIRTANALSSSGKRTAILIANRDEYSKIKARGDLKGKADFIESKNDTLRLMYAKRRIVISQPHHVIGLQFDAVILCSCSQTFNPHDAHQSYNSRRFVSDLYLGASRAKSKLCITSNDAIGYYPDFLLSAVSLRVAIGDET